MAVILPENDHCRAKIGCQIIAPPTDRSKGARQLSQTMAAHHGRRGPSRVYCEGDTFVPWRHRLLRIGLSDCATVSTQSAKTTVSCSVFRVLVGFDVSGRTDRYRPLHDEQPAGPGTATGVGGPP